MIEPFVGRAMPALLGAAAALTLMLAYVPAQADDVPGIGAWENYHKSYDPAPVTVRFQYREGTRDLLIPRQYIVFASGGFSSLDGPIPDLIETTAIKIVFTYPDGEAWTVATRDYMREHGVSADQAAVDLRERMNIVEILPANRTVSLSELLERRRSRHGEGLSGESGLIEYPIGRGSSTLYFGGEADEFLQITCSNPGRPAWLCKYNAHASPELFFRADLIDFRIFGGVDFANERIRMIKRKLCSFTEAC